MIGTDAIHPIVLIEGLDLAGKTTICRALVGRLEPRPSHFRNALTEHNPLYEATDRLRREDSLSGTFLGHAYLAAAALDLRLFHPPERLRIQESTIALRSLAYYRARGESAMADQFARILDNPAFPRFATVIVLTANIETRQRRLEKRRRDDPNEVAPDDLAVIHSPDVFRRMDEIIVGETVKRFGAKVIDTSHMAQSEVLETVLGIASVAGNP